MAHSTLVSSTSGNVNSRALYFVKTKLKKNNTMKLAMWKISGKNLALSGISKTASHLIAGVRRESSTASYESAWRKWVRWCSRKEINSFWCDINQFLEFIGELCEAGYEYRTIGIHGSAISLHHDLAEEMKVGVYPKVFELTQVFCNARPPQPKFSFIWDVKTVLNFIKESWGNKKKTRQGTFCENGNVDSTNNSI